MFDLCFQLVYMSSNCFQAELSDEENTNQHCTEVAADMRLQNITVIRFVEKTKLLKLSGISENHSAGWLIQLIKYEAFPL